MDELFDRQIILTPLAHQITAWLQPRLLDVPRPELTRLAVGRSLSVLSSPTLHPDPAAVFPAFRSNELGAPIRLRHLFGDGRWLVWQELIALHAGHEESRPDEIIQLLRAHLERGLLLLFQDWRESPSLAGFLERLQRKAGTKERLVPGRG